MREIAGEAGRRTRLASACREPGEAGTTAVEVPSLYHFTRQQRFNSHDEKAQKRGTYVELGSGLGARVLRRGGFGSPSAVVERLFLVGEPLRS